MDITDQLGIKTFLIQLIDFILFFREIETFINFTLYLVFERNAPWIAQPQMKPWDSDLQAP